MALFMLKEDAEASPYKQHVNPKDRSPSFLLTTRPKTKVKAQHNLCGDMLGLMWEERD